MELHTFSYVKGAWSSPLPADGEISPHGFGPCDLHNQTMTLTTIAEP